MATRKPGRDDDDMGSGFGGGDIGSFAENFGRGLWRRIWGILVILILLLSAMTSYYQVEPEQIALVTRLGRYVYTAQPGPHFKWPLGIESAIKVPVQRQLKEEFGFRTERPGVRSEFESPQDAKRESRMLTGDLNVADVEWIVQYKIRDPYQYVFRVRDVRGTLRDGSESVMRKVVGDHSVTEVLTVGRERIQQLAKDQLQELCNHYEMGVEILQLVLQDVNPPEPVRDSFNEVNQAIQERERAINQAWASYNSVIPEAQGKAEQAIQSAEGFATERVNNARGDVQRFVALQTEYQKSPAVTRSRLYLETMERIMPRAKRRVFVDDNIKGVLPVYGMLQGAKP